MFSSRPRSASDEKTLCQCRSGGLPCWALCPYSRSRSLKKPIKKQPSGKPRRRFRRNIPRWRGSPKLSGKVRVEVLVSPDGRVKGTRTLGGTPFLADAALEAIRMGRYEAGTKETTELVEIEFQGPKSISSIPVVFWLISEAEINNLPNPTRRVQSFGAATDLKFDSKGGRVQGLTV
jgi:hypothetical protein